MVPLASLIERSDERSSRPHRTANAGSMNPWPEAPLSNSRVAAWPEKKPRNLNSGADRLRTPWSCSEGESGSKGESGREARAMRGERKREGTRWIRGGGALFLVESAAPGLSFSRLLEDSVALGAIARAMLRTAADETLARIHVLLDLHRAEVRDARQIGAEASARACPSAATASANVAHGVEHLAELRAQFSDCARDRGCVCVLLSVLCVAEIHRRARRGGRGGGGCAPSS